MGRVLIATVVGAIVLFVWGFIFWMALPMEGKMRFMPREGETAVAAAMKAGIPETGVYFVPGFPEDDSAEARQAWEERHREGPVAMIVYTKEGKPPMPPIVFAKGFALNLVTAFLGAFLVAGAARGGAGYLSRALIVVYLGVFAAVAVHGANWIWMDFPWDHTAARMIDTIVGTALMGLAVAAIVRPKRA